MARASSSSQHSALKASVNPNAVPVSSFEVVASTTSPRGLTRIANPLHMEPLALGIARCSVDTLRRSSAQTSNAPHNAHLQSRSINGNVPPLFGIACRAATTQQAPPPTEQREAYHSSSSSDWLRHSSWW
jgi:hypothetical protein